MPFLGFIFKNKTFILTIRLLVLGLFLYGIILGFTHPTKENIFTRELFWGLFWSFFMVVTLASFGRIFCGICPHGFIGKYISKIGLKKKMPSWLKNPWWGLGMIVIGYWAVSYSLVGFYKLPLNTAIFFTFFTLLAIVIFYLYKDMSYCKYICPIGSVTRAYQRISSTWLGSYKEDCSSCKTFDCAKACSYNLKPFTFNNKNSMEDCSLCMDCAQACDAIHFSITPPAHSLTKKFSFNKIEVWTYILITAAISITMGLHHGLGHSAIAENLPWTKTAHFFQNFISISSFDLVGFFAFFYALSSTLFFVVAGMYFASKALKSEFHKTFYTLGYAFAPLFVIGGLSHLLDSFFTHKYADIANGFIYGLALPVDNVENLAVRGTSWLVVFGIFKYLAAALGFYILYKQIGFFKASKPAKTVAFFFASWLILFYLGIGFFKTYIDTTYGKPTYKIGMNDKVPNTLER